MQEEVVKSVDRHRKSSYGGYFSKIKNWDVRGKSSKFVREVLEDVKSCLHYNLNRIDKLKYVIELKSETVKNLKKSEKSLKKEIDDLKSEIEKVKRRSFLKNGRITQHKRTANKLRVSVREYKKELAELQKKSSRQEIRIDNLFKSKDRLRKKRAKTKVVYKDREVSKEELKFLRSVDSGEKSVLTRVGISTIALKTQQFLKSENLSFEHLSLMLSVEFFGGRVSKSEVPHSYVIFKNLETNEFITYDSSATGVRYYFLTLKGEEVVKRYKYKITYGKIK